MVRRLADQGLITHEPYRGVRLTSDGRRAALRTLRRHRILECYLTEVLGYPWDRVHEEAEQLEHAASEELIERMAAALGDPAQDPHGAPIPTRDGSVEEATLRTLALADLRERAKRRLFHAAIARGDRRAVRVLCRIAECRCHALDQLFRCGVLELFRFFVYPIPRVAEHFGEIALENAVATQGAQRGSASVAREAHAAIRLVRDQTLVGEATHHPAHRCRRDAQAKRDVVRRRRLADQGL